ncbi:hypothetical protein [Celeribacter naphthalenivorans]|uniref:hypothetical protein n=1 Tax=Celeribacter naphthalenivorans TaxID=1614694 RepID=UPI001CFA9EC3|nr:hypothetical protein [Celeribacter naphthalenivorans]
MTLPQRTLDKIASLTSLRELAGFSDQMSRDGRMTPETLRALAIRKAEISKNGA